MRYADSRQPERVAHPGAQQFVASRVALGRYQTASEVMREGLGGSSGPTAVSLLDGDAVFEEIRQLTARCRAETRK